jgi:Domain of unknown function DUF11
VLSGTPTTAGTYSFTVQAAPVSGAPVVSGPQSITVVAGAPATLTINGGNAQSTTATQPFAAPLSVVVKDANGNPVSGASVTFTVASGSATFGTSSSTTAVSGVNGVAIASALNAGRTAGAVSVTASITSASSVSVSFSETVLSITAARADLAVTVGAPASIARGATGTVTVTVTNNGPNAAAAVVAGLQLGNNLRITAGGGGTVNRQGDAVAWTTSGLASGASVTFTVTVQAETARRPYSTSAIGAVLSLVPDPAITNNAARATISAT